MEQVLLFLNAQQSAHIYSMFSNGGVRTELIFEIHWGSQGFSKSFTT